jgi:glycerate-2-kinase
MVGVRNREELLNNACSPTNRKAREIAINVIEKVLESVDPKQALKSKVTLTGNTLNIGGEAFNLADFKKIFVIGGGKASGPMAEALEEILGKRIADGIVVVPRGTADRYETKRIKLHEGSHPIPDDSSVEGAKKLLNLAESATKDDLVICVISGGGSSLMALPREGVTLSDKQKVTDMLLRSGATINEINTIRKHISGFKGGLLAKKVFPATLLSLLLSDVIGDPLDMIASGPTVPDSTTFMDASYVLERYDLWKKIPESVRQVLSEGTRGLIPETPKSGDPSFSKVYNIVIGNNRLACSAAVDELKRAGLKTLFLTSFMEGEARNVGSVLAALAREILISGNPISPPCGIIVGGESTVTVTGKGNGGRNQEIALGAALKIAHLDRAIVVSVSTDGIDGPTDAAGAIADGNTISRSEEKKMDAGQYLKDNDSYSFFSEIDDLIFTGSTGTNVNDLSILLVL